MARKPSVLNRVKNTVGRVRNTVRNIGKKVRKTVSETFYSRKKRRVAKKSEQKDVPPGPVINSPAPSPQVAAAASNQPPGPQTQA